MCIKVVGAKVEDLSRIVDIHMSAFPGFFLTFLGEGFLKAMYRGYIEYPSARLLVAEKNMTVYGFIAYSWDMTGLYKSFLKKRLLIFAWYGFLGALRNPRALIRIIRALKSPKTAQRAEPYIELTSIAVSPTSGMKGIGQRLIWSLMKNVENMDFSYITLKTDAINNDGVNIFYQKSGFSLFETSLTPEGRSMNEYRLEKQNLESALTALDSTKRRV